MPTYQYACTECGHGFEEFQAFTDDALTVCPQCGGKLRKVFSSVGIVFKGSGFYRNDSREKAPSGAAADKPAGDKPAGDKPAGDKQRAEPAGDGKSPEKSDANAKPAAKAPADASTGSTASGSKAGRSSTEGSAA